MRIQCSIKLLLSTAIAFGLSTWSVSYSDTALDADVISVGKTAPPNVVSGDLALHNSDFSRQVYVKKDGAMVLAFDSKANGIEFNNGDFISGAYDSNFSWGIDAQNKLYADYDDGESVRATLESVSGNKVTFDAVDSRAGISEKVVLYKALPLSLQDFEGEVLSFDMSNDPDCSAMTLGFKSGSVSLSGICSYGYSAATGTFRMHTDYDNLLVATFEGFSFLLALVEGDIGSRAKIVNVAFGSEGFVDYVDFADVINVENELTDPSLIYI